MPVLLTCCNNEDRLCTEERERKRHKWCSLSKSEVNMCQASRLVDCRLLLLPSDSSDAKDATADDWLFLYSSQPRRKRVGDREADRDTVSLSLCCRTLSY